MRKDPETWKCVGIGLLVWMFACTSILIGRADLSLGADESWKTQKEGVIFSRVITSEGESLITENHVRITP